MEFSGQASNKSRFLLQILLPVDPFPQYSTTKFTLLKVKRMNVHTVRKFFNLQGLSRKFLVTAFITKVIAGCILTIIYTYFYFVCFDCFTFEILYQKLFFLINLTKIFPQITCISIEIFRIYKKKLCFLRVLIKIERSRILS